MALTNKLTAIGDAIREKTNTTDLIPLSDMPDAIRNIQSSEGSSEEYFTKDNLGLRQIKLITYLTKIPDIDITGATSLKQLFYYSGLKNINLDLWNWDLSNITTIEELLANCSYLEDVNLDNIVMNQVTSCNRLCYNCKNLKRISIKNAKTSSLTTVSGLAEDCNILEEIDLSNWDTTNITNMSRLFRQCSNLKRAILKGWTGENVTDMDYMLQSCNKLQFLDMRDFIFDATVFLNIDSGLYQVNPGCEIIVKDEEQKAILKSINNNFRNIKTLAEYQAEGGV